MIHITQINLNRAREAHDVLEDRVRKDNLEICIINEANLKISNRRWNEDEDWIADEDADTDIWIVNQKIRIKNKEEKKGITWIETEGGLFIASCYFSPNRPIEEYEEYMQELEDIIGLQRTTHLLVAGHFNAASYSWGSQRTNVRGTILQLEEMAARRGLSLLNDGRAPTLSRNGPNGTRQEAYLDITYSSLPGNA